MSSSLASRVLAPRKAVALAVVLVALAIDLWTKDDMQRRLGMDPAEPHRSAVVEVIPGAFRLQGNWNRGITFGLDPGNADAIRWFTLVACVAILGVLAFTRSTSRLLHVALALILGGALGNLYDRWRWQQVRDFLVVYWDSSFLGGEWPAFNAADSFIVVGVLLIVWRELFGRRTLPVPPPASATTSAAGGAS